MQRCRDATRAKTPTPVWRNRMEAHAIIARTPHSASPHFFPPAMHVFFEDDGALKAGTILADNDTSLQIEAATGKRLKVKAEKVLLRFASPAPQALLDASEKMAADLD